ncbi:winged helix-turn-helix domain-containing protein [Vibrio lentus]|uniref:winged helix-turn-helix domain-containing protein n=1 Tax=Vibrio lentus TaxID=136468 RepID=UPI000CAC030B|nr:winged helix-turn-helix domain-containing protein [Vibrio lentus]PMH03881.1 hypothetical protein BCU78_01950 [Vibrio lentus]
MDFELDLDDNVIRRRIDGGEFQLGRKELLLLKALTDADGTLVKRTELLKSCWEGKIVTDSSLNVAIRNIRLALIECGSGMIVITIPRQGYCIKKNAGVIDKKQSECIASHEVDELYNKRSRMVRVIYYILLFIFSFVFCYAVYLIIVPYDFKTIRGVNVTSFGLSIDETYDHIFEHLINTKSTDVYIMPGSTNCGDIQVIASINDELVDLTNKFKMDNCDVV